ncbi:L-fuconolactonase [Tistlia consotensis]|uniref:L-fuconolactonase n=1 Tax=Tistlia consotensis USBA 355 TaxID=560819 RepID=A0A1Y6C008_9PROT|nr:amidohydrolase family protein [Tistlia consotensis]SMF29474.1 L-fuconolactonase [Tistlia consotensis USBA 355]SNR91265.1 L-fuconolactonase [Tistlia consotensis]
MSGAVDAHQHFWRLERGDYGWLTPDLAPLYRNFGPEDLAPELEACGVARTVLVQAAPTEAETGWLLDLAGRHPFVAGVVGWSDFEAADAPERIARLAERPGLKGLRPMIQDLPDPDWMLRAERAPAFEALVACGLSFDALVHPHHLPKVLRLLERHPDLPTVIDHGAKPRIRDGGFADWAPWIERLACETPAVCKLSGLATEDGPGWSAARLRPYVEHLLDCFGPERLIWGSDWPVLTLAGSYRAWHAAARSLLSGLDAAERAAVFGGNAAAFYRLGG